MATGYVGTGPARDLGTLATHRTGFVVTWMAMNQGVERAMSRAALVPDVGWSRGTLGPWCRSGDGLSAPWALVRLGPRSRWSRGPRSRGIEGAGDAGLLVPGHPVTAGPRCRWSRGPRSRGTEGPRRRGFDSTRDHGRSDNMCWPRGLGRAAAGGRAAGKGGARA